MSLTPQVFRWSDIDEMVEMDSFSTVPNVAGLSGRQLERLLRISGVIQIGATTTEVRREFRVLEIRSDGDFIAHFSSWTYHGRW